MRAWQFAATFCYLGKLPIAPGSWGSLGALILWIFLPVDFSIQLISILLLFIIGLISSNKAVKVLDDQDPSEVVIDEAAGMGIALFMIPHTPWLFFLAFVLFRFFDILKPSFIYRTQSLPGGWGIMLDDVLAALFTLAIVHGIAYTL